MKKLLFVFSLFFCSTVLTANGDNPVVPISAQSILDVKVKGDFILIEYLRKTDLDIKRPIYIHNADGKRIFKSKAGFREQITELNMAQMKPGVYLISTVINNRTIEIRYKKE